MTKLVNPLLLDSQLHVELVVSKESGTLALACSVPGRTRFSATSKNNLLHLNTPLSFGLIPSLRNR